MKTFLLIILLLISLSLCQTNINIYNGASNGNNCNNNCGENNPTNPTTNPTTCPRQRFNVFNPFYSGPNDRIVNGVREGLIFELWAEVRKRNPIFPDYTSTSLVTGSISDITDLLLSARQDLGLESLGKTPENIALGLKFSINPFPYVSTSDRYFYSNLPKTAIQSTGSCVNLPDCFSNGWCSNNDLQKIADYSINNGNVPVVVTYNIGSTRFNDGQSIKQQLTSKGVKNVTLNGIKTTNFYQDMFNYAVKISSISPLTEINFIDAVVSVPFQQCKNFASGTQLSLVTLSLPNFQSGFTFNPNVDSLYFDAFNNILNQFISEHYICKLGVKYRGFCNDQKNPFWRSSENYCAKMNWSDLPECA